ncbi:hypothetical protein [Phenylobacterium sp.]|uniref:hypothetical protein n=1 Tax=Phenylobacterium sp. TaxID=1871053 RepID=UPI00272568DF|nr:hypothetical protein [Phenylobacterium sp.]MDO8801823.1 hypothetical protein [Phenylobacterium sp.]
MIDILAWDWTLHVATNQAVTRSKARSLALDYGRDFNLHGRVRAPREHRGKDIKVTLSPFGPNVRFGRGGQQHVGELTARPEGSDFDFEATLILPAAAIATTATSLASRWKHIQIKTDGAKVSAYFFDAGIHPNLEAWANAD